MRFHAACLRESLGGTSDLLAWSLASGFRLCQTGPSSAKLLVAC